MALPPPSPLSQAVRLFQKGQLDLAARHCATALRQRPNSFDAAFLLGVIRASQGKMVDAADGFGKAAALDPASFAAHKNLGVALGHLNRHDEAIASFERALMLKPDDADTHGALGVILAETNRHDAAIKRFEMALAIDPANADTQNNLGVALMAMNRHEAAVARFERALALRPRDVDTLVNLGNGLRHLLRHGDAVVSFKKALALNDNNAAAHNGLGVTLAAMKHPEAAVASFQKALTLTPRNAEMQINFGNALKTLKRYDAALASLEMARALKPDDANALSLIAAVKQRLCDWRRLDLIEGRLIDDVRSNRAAVTPFLVLTIADDPVLQLACARQYGTRKKIAAAPVVAPPSAAHGKLRLGYLSADFHDHATARLMAALFERHDRARFEVSAFSYGPDDKSPMRQRLETAFDHFIDVGRENDADAARRIAEREIDILVDLKGYTEDGRLEILAHRPAPVQVHYLGYPGTLGVDFIDYMMVDPFIVPPDQQDYFTEKLVYLPGCYQVNDPERRISGEVPTRLQCGLPEEGFVFCSFNNSYKITPAVFAVWMRLLAAVPGSVLWLLSDNPWAEENLRREATAQGIEPQRLVFAPRLPLPDHLARHRLADLFLDTLPVNAHTTASDALWAGLPVLSCAGRSFVARVAGSLVRSAGLAELAVESLTAYEGLALALAREPERLRAIRRKLDEGRGQAPLFDIDRTGRQIEAAYLAMRDIHRRGKEPHSFAVTPDLSISATE